MFATLPQSFNGAAQAFFNSTDSLNSAVAQGKGGGQEQVLTDMVNFMMMYELWADNPHGSFTTYSLSAAAQNSDSISNYLWNAANRLGWEAGTAKSPGNYAGLLQ
jgi:hypothetical protein